MATRKLIAGNWIADDEPMMVQVIDDASLTDAELRASPILVTDGALPDLTGTWGYAAGVAGSVILTGGKRLLAITAVGPTSGSATVTIDGGDSITIPANNALTIGPAVQLVDPVLVFTGTLSYFVEFLT